MTYKVVTTEDLTVVTEQVAGIQGVKGDTGATGATGATGSSGVVGVTSPITNSGTSTSANIGIDQTALTLDTSQITWSAITAWAPNTSYTKGALVEYQGISYRRASTGTSGSTFNTANWTQTGPTPASTNTASTLVLRDGSGNFSAGTITAALTGNASTATTASTLSSALATNLGGTGSTYGSLMVGHGQLNATATKNANDTTPEAIFRTGTANSTIQYFNVDADTVYFFEGWIQLGKTTTSSVVNTSLLYVQTGSTTALTEQAARLSVQYFATTTQIGVGSASATATTAASPATTATGVYCTFRGFIRTNATTAGRINIAQWLDTAGASAPTYVQGSYLNLYKVGAGNTQMFGNWS